MRVYRPRRRGIQRPDREIKSLQACLPVAQLCAKTVRFEGLADRFWNELRAFARAPKRNLCNQETTRNSMFASSLGA
jgi:hypothetical protein